MTDGEATGGTQDSSYQPAGYCCYCGYQMDPGRCPECGRNVSARRLLRTPPRSALGRWAIRGAVLLVLGGALWGAHRLYRSGKWIEWLPASVLLHYQPSISEMDLLESRQYEDDRVRRLNHWSSLELYRRFALGELSDDDARRMLVRASLVGLSFSYPSDLGEQTALPMYVVERRFGLLLPGAWRGVGKGNVEVVEKEWTVTVDGAAVATLEAPQPLRPPQDYSISLGPPRGDWHGDQGGTFCHIEQVFPDLPLPSLSPGDHVIAAAQTVELYSAGRLLHSNRKTATADFHIAEKNSTSQRYAWLPEQAAQLTEQLHLELKGDPARDGRTACYDRDFDPPGLYYGFLQIPEKAGWWRESSVTDKETLDLHIFGSCPISYYGDLWLRVGTGAESIRIGRFNVQSGNLGAVLRLRFRDSMPDDPPSMAIMVAQTWPSAVDALTIRLTPRCYGWTMGYVSRTGDALEGIIEWDFVPERTEGAWPGDRAAGRISKWRQVAVRAYPPKNPP